MQFYQDFKVVSPTSVAEILRVRHVFQYDISGMEERAKLVLTEQLNYSDAFIAKKNQILGIKMGQEYRFAKATDSSVSYSDTETWYFSYEDNFLSFTELVEQLKKGYSLTAPLPGGKYGVYAEPEDADLLQLHSGFAQTWKTLVKAYTMNVIERAAMWTPPVTSMALFDLVLVDRWPGRELGEEPTPLTCTLKEMSRLFKDWDEVICNYVKANAYAVMEVEVSDDKVIVKVLDDIRAIQSSLAEMHRQALEEDEVSSY